MTSLEEIESAASRLSLEEFARLRNWILERDGLNWDRQLAEDEASGKLEALYEDLMKEPGETRPLNELLDDA